MIAIEKVLLLKSIVFFKFTPDDILLQIAASIVKEKIAKAGERIVEKGKSNNTLYIVVSGRVKVHDNEILIGELGEREIFAELSALTASLPVASVSALSDCLFLTIESSELYELMSIDVGLSIGIIHGLCHRIQAMSMQISDVLGV